MSDPNGVRPDPDDTEDVFETVPVDPKVERFLGGAVGRIRHTMLILGAIAIAGCVVNLGLENCRWRAARLHRFLRELSLAGACAELAGRAHNCCWIKGFEHRNGVPVPAALCLYRHRSLCYIQRFC